MYRLFIVIRSMANNSPEDKIDITVVHLGIVLKCMGYILTEHDKCCQWSIDQ